MYIGDSFGTWHAIPPHTTTRRKQALATMHRRIALSDCDARVGRATYFIFAKCVLATYSASLCKKANGLEAPVSCTQFVKATLDAESRCDSLVSSPPALAMAMESAQKTTVYRLVEAPLDCFDCWQAAQASQMQERALRACACPFCSSCPLSCSNAYALAWLLVWLCSLDPACVISKVRCKG
jgi:hypothetical protein